MSRTYVITGAGSGIGSATTRLLREAGHTAIGIDLKNSDVTADLSTPAGRAEGVEKALEAADGSVNAVIACAGLASPTRLTAAVNFYGAIGVLEGLRPALAKADAPRAAVISSLSSVQPLYPPLVDAFLNRDEPAALEIAEQLAADPQSGNLIYASTKRAISVWVRRQSITDAWAGVGIPLNAVGPGVVETPMTAPLLVTKESTAFVDAAVPMPLNYHQPAASIANLLIWLTSPENTHCAGQTIYCDGGAEVILRGEDVFSWADQIVLDYFMKLAPGADG